jgi:TonB family protein
MNHPSKPASPQHSAIGGPLPVLLDFRNGGRGWRMSLGALVQAALLGLVLTLPLLMTDKFIPQPLTEALPPYQQGDSVTIVEAKGGGGPKPTPKINPGGLTSPFSRTTPKVDVAGPTGLFTEFDNEGPAGRRGVPWGVENGVPVQSPVGPPAATPQPPPPEEPIVVGGKVRPPRLIHQTEPVYPRMAAIARIQGDVVLEALLDKDGRVRNVEIKSGHPALAEAARTAVAQWVYEPTYLNGVPYPVLLTVTVEFRLKH